MIRYLDKVVRPYVLMMLKMSGYVKTSTVKDKGEDKKNKLMSFRIDDENLIEKYKTISTKIEDLQQNWLNCCTSLWWYKKTKKNKIW